MKEKKNTEIKEEPKAKTKKVLMEEQRLLAMETRKQHESVIKSIMLELDRLCRTRNIDEKTFEIAVGRWKSAKQQRRAAQKEIAAAEAKLEEVRRRYGK